MRTAAIDPIHTAQGALVARARRAAGLTQADLAERLGVPLFLVDRIEQGAVDAGSHLPMIAEATELPVSALRPRLSPTATAAVVEPDKPIEEHGVAAPGRLLVIGTLSILILVRFFSEKIRIIPEVSTFVDVPILVVLLVAWGILQSPTRRVAGHARPFVVIAAAFFAWSCVSTLFNLDRVAPAPTLVFVYGFLGPLLVYAAFYHFWPAGNARWLTRFFVGAVLLQFAIVLLMDLPTFLATDNPDKISGTFGDNGYQLTIFLLVMMGLLVGVAVFDSRTLIARFVPGLVLGIALVVFLAQFRSLIPGMLITLVVVGVVVSAGRLRGAGVALLVGLVVLGALQFVATQFELLKYQSGFAGVKNDPALFVDARLGMVRDLADVYAGNPRFVITGTGPGTFSTRAWRTFAETARTRTNVAAGLAERINGGRYVTDVGEKYTLPRYRNAEVIEGSRAATQPFSSYVGPAAEVGLPGLALLMMAYGFALVTALRMALATVRSRRRDDPVAPLTVAALTAFLLLLQAAVLENWLEVSRVTFLAWGLLAIATKELHGRQPAESEAAVPAARNGHPSLARP